MVESAAHFDGNAGVNPELRLKTCTRLRPWPERNRRPERLTREAKFRLEPEYA